MKYRLHSDNHKFSMRVGSSLYCMEGTSEDIISLSFDEDDQSFYATIKRPSERTQYLAQRSRLGITLCKLNTGVSQRKHRQRPTHGGEIEHTFVKKKYHPRWSRCGRTVFPVRSLNSVIRMDISDLEDGLFNLKPNQKRTLGERYGPDGWFTHIKATLVSTGTHASYSQGAFKTSRADRAYKTLSNRIHIYYDREEDKIAEKIPGSHGKSSGFTVTPLGFRTFRLEFSNLSSYWSDTYVDIIMATLDISNPHSHGEYKHVYDVDGDPRQYGVLHFVRRHSNENSVLDTVYIDRDTNYIDVTLPDLAEVDIESDIIHKRVYHAYEKAVSNHFYKGGFFYNSPVWIQVRKHGCDSKMQCLNETGEGISYDTGLEIDIYTTS